MASIKNVSIGGDDFKSGQTKMKSVLTDFLVSSGIKPVSIVSYNHVGNNDGKNLAEEAQFKSKEISKSSVVDDIIQSNPVLYPIEKGQSTPKNPDHVIPVHLTAVANGSTIDSNLKLVANVLTSGTYPLLGGTVDILQRYSEKVTVLLELHASGSLSESDFKNSLLEMELK